MLDVFDAPGGRLPKDADSRPDCREHVMSDEDEQHEKAFTVDDRRRFTASGDTKENAAGSGGHPGSGAAGENSEPRDAENRPNAGLTFSGFVIGLAQQAFVSLGLVQDPQTSTVRKDLPQAKAMIDVLAMLRDKTRGNLDEVEARMMDEMLDELRLRYVRESRDARKPQDQGG
jgi:hypothetical protein